MAQTGNPYTRIIISLSDIYYQSFGVIQVFIDSTDQAGLIDPMLMMEMLCNIWNNILYVDDFTFGAQNTVIT